MIGTADMATRHKKQNTESEPSTRVLRAVRKAERQAGDGADIGGTGFTILKLRQPPVAKLIDQGKIGPEELEAAQEISQAFTALASRLMVRGMVLERVDGGRPLSAAAAGHSAKAAANYTAWANHWSDRAKSYADPMLEVVIAAVIDERPIRQIGADVGRHHSRVERGLIAGLQDYAARAGFISGSIAARWKRDAEAVFVAGNAKLADAVRRARVER